MELKGTELVEEEGMVDQFYQPHLLLKKQQYQAMKVELVVGVAQYLQAES